MAAMADFDWLRPATLADAAALLARPGARLLAGGTDLLPNLRRGLLAPRCLVDLGALPGFDAVEALPHAWRLGAGVTLATLARDGALAETLPALAQAAGSVAGPGHRSAATLGGNLCQDTRCVFYNQSEWWRAANGYCLKHGGDTCHVAPQGRRCHAAYEGDLAPALLAYGAEVEVVGAATSRRMALASLYRNDGAAHLTLAGDEIIAAVQVPRPQRGSVSAYRKLRSRGAMDFPLAGVAVALQMQGGLLTQLRIGISGTNAQPFLLEGTDAMRGRAVDDGLLQALGKLVQKQVSPMRSTVTASQHRRLVAAVAAQRLVRHLSGP
jgi:4-hydroxybenzoyl-CoA reductase subunit beta